MKRRIAHAMRRIARALIAKSNKLDPPQRVQLKTAVVSELAPGAREAAEIGARLAERALRYGYGKGM